MSAGNKDSDGIVLENYDKRPVNNVYEDFIQFVKQQPNVNHKKLMQTNYNSDVSNDINVLSNSLTEAFLESSLNNIKKTENRACKNFG